MLIVTFHLLRCAAGLDQDSAGRFRTVLLSAVCVLDLHPVRTFWPTQNFCPCDTHLHTSDQVNGPVRGVNVPIKTKVEGFIHKTENNLKSWNRIKVSTIWIYFWENSAPPPLMTKPSRKSQIFTFKDEFDQSILEWMHEEHQIFATKMKNVFRSRNKTLTFHRSCVRFVVYVKMQ